MSIASAYEEAGDSSNAETVYKGLADSSFRDGAAYLHSRDEVALVRYHNAGAFTQYLTEDRDRYVLISTHAEAECLRDMRRFPEALAATNELSIISRVQRIRRAAR